MLNQMTEWYMIVENGFGLSVGKSEKYCKRYLPGQICRMYTKTYSDSNYHNIWTSINVSRRLSRLLASKVAAHFGSTYDRQEDADMMKYIDFVKSRSGCDSGGCQN